MILYNLENLLCYYQFDLNYSKVQRAAIYSEEDV